MTDTREDTNVSASYRSDDGAIVVSTDAYVSHHKQSGPWRSTFSMNQREAARLRDEIDAALRKARGAP